MLVSLHGPLALLGMHMTASGLRCKVYRVLAFDGAWVVAGADGCSRPGQGSTFPQHRAHR